MNTLPTDEEIAQAKALDQAKGRDVHLITVKIQGDEFHAIVIAPPKPDYRRFMGLITGADAVATMKAQEQLVKDCVLWPDDTELAKSFEQKALLASDMANQLALLAGHDAQVTVKKL